MCGTVKSSQGASPWRRRVVAAVGLASGAIACALGACGSRVQSFAPPKVPVTAIRNNDYQTLLDKYVGDDGNVAYGMWKDDAHDVAALDDYLSKLTNSSPDSRPDLFKTQPDKLSYWINLYNALVLREILRRWPLDSVTAVRVNATSFIKTGKGFFYDLKFVVGGAEMNLYDIENKIIRAQFKDARIHFAINCGSASCPLLRKDAFDPEKLEGQLTDASAQFVNDGKNVRVDDAKKQVTMSKIFDWYTDDFVAFTKQRTNVKEATVVDFALLYAREPLKQKLEAAKVNRYNVAFIDYDWNVNKREPSLVRTAAPASPSGVGRLVPELEWKLLEGGTWRPSTARGNVVLIDFWATYCKPCKASFPKFQELVAKHRDDGLVVIGISEDDEPKQVVPGFLKETGAQFLIGIDPDHTASSAPFNVSAMPTQLIIDRRGVVRHRHEGLKDGELEEIAREIEELLKDK